MARARKHKQRERGTGCVTRLPGSRNYYILYYDNGRQIRESTGTPIKQRAIALLQKRLGEKALGMAPAQDLKQLKYEHIRQSLLDDYAMKRRHLLQAHADGSVKLDGLPHLDGFFQGRSVGAIAVDLLRKFITKRQADGAEPSTINRNLALLRRMMNLARKDGKLRSVPHFPMLKENPAREGFLNHEQFAKLLAALPERLRPLILFLYWTGCRIGEARKVTWEQVDLDRRQIALRNDQTKNEEGRILPLPDELVETLERVPKKEGHVFYQGEFRRSWMSACAQAKLGRRVKQKGWYKYKGLIVHDLRRSAVRNLREAGVPETIIMKISGHKTYAVFRRYSIVSPEDLHQAMRRAQAAAKVIDVSPTRASLPPANNASAANASEAGVPQPENNTSLIQVCNRVAEVKS